MRELSATSQQSAGPSMRRVVERIFEVMEDRYGSLWTSRYGGVPLDRVMGTWESDLHGMSIAELKRGMDACKAKDFPPTLPEFAKLCRPPVDFVSAYHEAVSGVRARQDGEMGVWSHPAIFWAASKVSAFDLLTQTYQTVKDRFNRALEAELSAGCYADIPQPSKTLPAPSKSVLDADSQKQLIEKAADLIVEKQQSCKVDHKRWAKKIMERHGKKDPYLPSIAVKMAKEALGIDGGENG